MFTDNPFAGLSASVSPMIMQAYVVVMIILVVGGTLYDIQHKRSAHYFFRIWRSAIGAGKRQVTDGEVLSRAIQAVGEGLVSGEFCNARRRIAHLLTMYGFLAYAITTVIMVFWYATPSPPTPTLLPLLWHIGALMVCAGGYWFWFFLRIDVTAEGHSPLRIVQADLFILSLLASTTMALIWSFLQAADSAWANVALGLYVAATTVLFGAVPWSKFSHMFYKPAAALQRRLEEANGSRKNLPFPTSKPEIFGSARKAPRNY